MLIHVMKFQEFWKELQVELRKDKEFKTLKQNKKFKACFDHNKKGDLFVHVTLTLGEPRGQIPFNEFEGIWDNVKRYSRETRFVNKSGRLESYIKQNGETGKTVHVPYIITLIDHVLKNQNME